MRGITNAVGGGTKRNGDNVALSSEVVSTTLKLVPPKGLYDGVTSKVTITDADFIAGNIKTGVNLFGLNGVLEPKKIYRLTRYQVSIPINKFILDYQNGGAITQNYPSTGSLRFGGNPSSGTTFVRFYYNQLLDLSDVDGLSVQIGVDVAGFNANLIIYFGNTPTDLSNQIASVNINSTPFNYIIQLSTQTKTQGYLIFAVQSFSGGTAYWYFSNIQLLQKIT